MKKNDSLHIALVNLRANKIRSFLSMLGIVIGTGAVIVITAVVNGIGKATMQQMSLGAENTLTLRAKFSESSGRMGKITMDDLNRLEHLPLVEYAMPESQTMEKARGTQGLQEARLLGINTAAFKMYDYTLINGNFITSDDVERRRRVCLIDEDFAKKIFGIEYAVGQRVRLEKTSLEIIGIVSQPDRLRRIGKKGDLLLPYTTHILMDGRDNFMSVEIQAKTGRLNELQKELEEMIQANPRQAGLLEIMDPRTYMQQLEKWRKMLMLQVVLVSGISLLVGGVGLMNVMLITVAERTREIGLRKALGASANIILRQFLVESAVLSGCGGLIGVFLGFLISRLIEIVSGGSVQSAVVPLFALGSFLFSVILGIFSGLYPASKAAHLSPVEALRYE